MKVYEKQIIEFTLFGEKYFLDTKKRTLTGGDELGREKIQQIISQCQKMDFVKDPYPTGGGAVIDDPYGQPYQFSLCLFAMADFLGDFPDELHCFLYGMSNEELEEFLREGGVF